jgi:hypothetical protein
VNFSLAFQTKSGGTTRVASVFWWRLRFCKKLVPHVHS